MLGPLPREPAAEIAKAFVLGQELRGRCFKVGDDLFNELARNFNELARKLGMSAGTAKRRYYSFPRMTADHWAEFAGAIKNGTVAAEDRKYLIALSALEFWLERCRTFQESAEKCEQKDLSKKCP